MDFGYIRGKPLPNPLIFRFCDQLSVTLLKHLGVNARRPVLVAVVLYLVDEEQGQHLDVQVAVAQFLVQMRLDGTTDLRALDDALVHVADGLTQRDLLGVAELDMLISRRAVDSRDGVAIIQFPLAGQEEQVRSRLDRYALAADHAGFAFNIHFYLCAEALFVGYG